MAVAVAARNNTTHEAEPVTRPTGAVHTAEGMRGTRTDAKLTVVKEPVRQKVPTPQRSPSNGDATVPHAGTLLEEAGLVGAHIEVFWEGEEHNMWYARWPITYPPFTHPGLLHGAVASPGCPLRMPMA